MMEFRGAGKEAVNAKLKFILQLVYELETNDLTEAVNCSVAMRDKIDLAITNGSKSKMLVFNIMPADEARSNNGKKPV